MPSLAVVGAGFACEFTKNKQFFTFFLFVFKVYLLLADHNDHEIDDGKETALQTPPGMVNFGNICFVNSSLQVEIHKKSIKYNDFKRPCPR